MHCCKKKSQLKNVLNWEKKIYLEKIYSMFAHVTTFLMRVSPFWVELKHLFSCRPLSCRILDVPAEFQLLLLCHCFINRN